MQGISDICVTVGLTPSSGEHGFAPVPQSILIGTMCGLVAAFGANIYLHVLNLSTQWQLWKQDAELTSFLTRADKPSWLIFLTVIAAPIFEEFIFRGLVFRGLRRTTGPALAVIACAALFALVHPHRSRSSPFSGWASPPLSASSGRVSCWPPSLPMVSIICPS
jgi:membrane protease YdiL (CAAX protease family)